MPGVTWDEEGALGLVGGVSVGHATDETGRTGVTAVIFEPPAVGGVDVRGGAPGTRETDLLSSENLVARVDAFVLAGGSAFGLDAATGVSRFLEEKGRGFETGKGRVPIVPAAVLFDLGRGASRRPDAAMGAEAARRAVPGDRSRGRVGAGAGCFVGKALGLERAAPSGIGQASARLPGGARVGALAAVNAFGDVVSGEKILAGARGDDGAFVPTLEALAALGDPPWKREATTICVVATDAPLGKVETTWLARMAHAGMARAISPVWTSLDGDLIFSASTGLGPRAGVDALGALAALVLERAIRDAVSS